MSFKKGMGELIDALAAKYKSDICTQEEVGSFTKANNRFIVQTNRRELSCDELFLCTPAYSAAQILFNFNKVLTEELRKIRYVPVAVVGLIYQRSAFVSLPRGFGYLIPASEHKSVLGTIFSSNIFDGRTDDNRLLFQVMIGGARNAGITGYGKEKLIRIAEEEIFAVLHANEKPIHKFFAFWPRAIPQYDQPYPQIIEKISGQLSQIKRLKLVSNYWGGVSLNDCILNARRAADNCSL